MTMIELLIVMVLMAVILPAIVSVYIYGSKTFGEELTESGLQSEAQTILDEIALDARNALSVEPTYNGYTTGTTSVVLRVPALDNSQHIVYSGSNMVTDVVIYYFQNNIIYKKIYADPSSSRYPQNNITKALATNILQLSFDYDPDPASATLVDIIVQNNQSIGKVTKEFTVTSKARLRNHI